MTIQIKHFEEQVKWEPWKAMAIAFGAGAAFMGAMTALLTGIITLVLRSTGHG